MKAVEELPGPTKNIIFPVIRLRPWLTTKELKKAVDRIKAAFGERPFGLDLDSTRRGHRDSAAYKAFDQLFNEDEGFLQYYQFVATHQSAVPVLRSTKMPNLSIELNRVKDLDRGLVVRIDIENPINITQLIEEIVRAEIENIVFVFDCGWHSALLPYQAQCVGLIRTLLDLSDKFEVVVAGGDFPDSGFDKLGTHFQIAGEERSLVDVVRRQINEASIVFGDWASTRAPSTDNEIRRGRPRIDMPTRDGWECWRRATAGKSYEKMAQSAVSDRKLGEKSDFWGEQMIIATRSGIEPSIKSPTTAAAVRINLHMILQAHFDTGGWPQLGDELVEGEL